MAHQQPATAADHVTLNGHALASKDSNSDSLSDLKAKPEEDVDNINYPPPWKWEKFFIGGYSQGRMIKFKKSKTMYMAINLFAGVAIMFYGYDQGVMSQVNLNEDYWNQSRFMNPKSDGHHQSLTLMRSGDQLPQTQFP